MKVGKLGLEQILALGQAFGITPKNLLRDLTAARVRTQWEAQIAAIVQRLDKEGVRLTSTGDAGADEEAERRFVRAVLFALWKVTVRNGHLADVLRDAQDDKIVAIVGPAINPATPPLDAGRRVMEATLRLTF